MAKQHNQMGNGKNKPSIARTKLSKPKYQIHGRNDIARPILPPTNDRRKAIIQLLKSSIK
jgi:hypothetical protein